MERIDASLVYAGIRKATSIQISCLWHSLIYVSLPWGWQSQRYGFLSSSRAVSLPLPLPLPLSSFFFLSFSRHTVMPPRSSSVRSMIPINLRAFSHSVTRLGTKASQTWYRTSACHDVLHYETPFPGLTPLTFPPRERFSSASQLLATE